MKGFKLGQWKVSLLHSTNRWCLVVMYKFRHQASQVLSRIDDDEHLVFAVANGGGKTQCQVLILGPQLHCHFLALGSTIVAELLESGRHWRKYFSWDAHLKKFKWITSSSSYSRLTRSSSTHDQMSCYQSWISISSMGSWWIISYVAWSRIILPNVSCLLCMWCVHMLLQWALVSLWTLLTASEVRPTCRLLEWLSTKLQFWREFLNSLPAHCQNRDVRKLFLLLFLCLSVCLSL
jgi:hypothetical protein